MWSVDEKISETPLDTGDLQLEVSPSAGENSTRTVLWLLPAGFRSMVPSCRCTADSRAVRWRTLPHGLEKVLLQVQCGPGAAALHGQGTMPSLGTAPCPLLCVFGAVMGQSGHILRVIRTATNTAIEIPTRNHGGAIGVYGSVEQRSLAERAIRIAATPGSLTAVSTDGPRSIPPLWSPWRQSRATMVRHRQPRPPRPPVGCPWPPCSSSQTPRVRRRTMTRKCT